MTTRPLSAIALALACLTSLPAFAVGTAVDVQVIDRETGRAIQATLHQGEWWIAGRPGARYAVRLANRDQRTLGVLSIDGVNAVSGDTAAWNQTGYVLEPRSRFEVNGWRKNQEQVAAFEFTALPDSYAARTGRPANVGVIGLAIFRERARPPAPSIGVDRPPRERLDDGARSERSTAAPAAAPAREQPAEAPAESAPETMARAKAADRLGTGHGEIEHSPVAYTRFERRGSTPDEIVTIRYDRLENLIAMGIVPRPRTAVVPVDPFPQGGRFVPDPPPR